MAYQTLSYIYDPKYIKKLKYDTFNSLLHGYKISNTDQPTEAINDSEIISALDNYNSILEESSVDKIAIESIENMTLYDRLYLGLPINKDEYFYVNDLPSDDIEEGIIKKLINNFKQTD